MELGHQRSDSKHGPVGKMKKALYDCLLNLLASWKVIFYVRIGTN